MKSHLKTKLNEFEKLIREYLSSYKKMSHEDKVSFGERIGMAGAELIDCVMRKRKFSTIPDERRIYLKIILELINYEVDMADYFREELDFQITILEQTAYLSIKKHRASFLRLCEIVGEILENYQNPEDVEKLFPLIMDAKDLSSFLIEEVDNTEDMIGLNFPMDDRLFASDLIKLIMLQASTIEYNEKFITKDDILKKFDILKAKLGIRDVKA